ncbi:MAG: DUF4124 domain-containing protein [Desulfobacterales bacterium]|nr:DUF4124 domain-containing protein [Desulfobacterales bacterium]
MIKILMFICVFIHLFAPVGDAEMYKWRDESGVLHFSDIQPNQNDSFETVKIPKSASSDITLPEFGLLIKDIDMVWYLSGSGLQKEKTYHPQIEFVVLNDSEKYIDGLKIKGLFIEGSNKIFGDTTEYLSEIPPKMVSKTVFMRPSMGYIYNGHNRSTITKKIFDVQMTVFLDSQAILQKNLRFNTRSTK